MIDYNALPPDSRVWIYQSNRAFSPTENDEIQDQVRQFIQQWQSHGKAVKAWGTLQYNRFIIFIVDESYEPPSGCSIDSSVALIKQLEQTYQVDFFDRMNFAYKKDHAVLAANRSDFAQLYQNGSINDQTIVFNNLVNTKKDLEDNWEIALGTSWHARMV